ncbi:RsiV family protein [bacterium]|nr:RsiV family protein [bacterium]
MRTRAGENKSIYFIILLLVVIAFAYAYNQNWFGLFSKKEGDIRQSEEKKVEEPVQKVYQLSSKEINEESNGSMIAIEYPSFGTAVDSKIKEVIDLKISDFKNSSGEALINSDQFINISFSSANYSREIYGIKYDIVYGGGIRPIEDIECHTYNLDTSKEVFLRDVFKENSEYLSKLSEATYVELLKDKTVDKNWVKEGTAAKEENFKNFIIDKENISFYFAPGIVAPNTAGVKKVSVPLSSLKYFLNNYFN